MKLRLGRRQPPAPVRIPGRNSAAIVRRRVYVLTRWRDGLTHRLEVNQELTDRERGVTRSKRDALDWVLGLVDELESRGLMLDVEVAAKLERNRAALRGSVTYMEITTAPPPPPPPPSGIGISEKGRLKP